MKRRMWFIVTLSLLCLLLALPAAGSAGEAAIAGVEAPDVGNWHQAGIEQPTSIDQPTGEAEQSNSVWLIGLVIVLAVGSLVLFVLRALRQASPEDSS